MTTTNCFQIFIMKELKCHRWGIQVQSSAVWRKPDIKASWPIQIIGKFSDCVIFTDIGLEQSRRCWARDSRDQFLWSWRSVIHFLQQQRHGRRDRVEAWLLSLLRSKTGNIRATAASFLIKPEEACNHKIWVQNIFDPQKTSLYGL